MLSTNKLHRLHQRRHASAFAAHITRYALSLSAACAALTAKAETEYILDPAPAYSMRSHADVSISRCLEQPDGRIVIASSVRYIDGIQVGGFNRLLPDGQLDPTFTPATSGMGQLLTNSANGGLLAIGPFLQSGSTTGPALARLTADGALDPNFQIADLGGIFVRDILPTSDGGCYLLTVIAATNSSSVIRFASDGQPTLGFPNSVNIGTGFTSASVGPDNQLAFLRPNSSGPAAVVVMSNTGALQPALTAIPANFRPFSLVYEPDGSLVISGQTFPGTGPGLLRILPNGARDLGFSGTSPFNNYGGANITRLSEGSFATMNVGNTPAGQPNVLRFSSSGVYLPAASVFLDGSPDGTLANLGLSPLADGDYMITGRFNQANGTAVRTVARISAQGEVRPEFQVDFAARGRVIAITPFGTDDHLLTGSFTEVGEHNAGNLALLHADDSVSSSVPYLTHGPSIVRNNIALLDGGAVVFGNFTPFPGTGTTGLLKIKPDGQVDTAFLAGLTLFGFEAGTQLPDGRIILGGRFGAQPTPTPPASYLARVLTDGTLDPSFNNRPTLTGSNAGITALAADGAGNVIVAGSFTGFQGTPRPGLARVLSDGQIDPSFAPAVGVHANPVARQLTMLPDGRFYVLGARSDQALPATARLLRFTADGTIDDDFSPPSLNGRTALAYIVAPDGSIFVAAGPLHSDGANPPGSPVLLKLSAEGELLTTLSSDFDSPIQSLTIDEQGRVLAGGMFTNINGQPREALARFSPIPFGVTIDGPSALVVLKHASLTLEAKTISSPDAVAFQWYHDGEALVGETNATLQLTHIVHKHTGVYTVLAQSGNQTATSAAFSLHIQRVHCVRNK
jgi:uncharacterized delta-60 repeat protein